MDLTGFLEESIPRLEAAVNAKKDAVKQANEQVVQCEAELKTAEELLSTVQHAAALAKTVNERCTSRPSATSSSSARTIAISSLASKCAETSDGPVQAAPTSLAAAVVDKETSQTNNKEYTGPNPTDAVAQSSRGKRFVQERIINLVVEGRPESPTGGSAGRGNGVKQLMEQAGHEFTPAAKEEVLTYISRLVVDFKVKEPFGFFQVHHQRENGGSSCWCKNQWCSTAFDETGQDKPILVQSVVMFAKMLFNIYSATYGLKTDIDWTMKLPSTIVEAAKEVLTETDDDDVHSEEDMVKDGSIIYDGPMVRNPPKTTAAAVKFMNGRIDKIINGSKVAERGPTVIGLKQLMGAAFTDDVAKKVEGYLAQVQTRVLFSRNRPLRVTKIAHKSGAGSSKCWCKGVWCNRLAHNSTSLSDLVQILHLVCEADDDAATSSTSDSPLLINVDPSILPLVTGVETARKKMKLEPSVGFLRRTMAKKTPCSSKLDGFVNDQVDAFLLACKGIMRSRFTEVAETSLLHYVGDVSARLTLDLKGGYTFQGAEHVCEDDACWCDGQWDDQGDRQVSPTLDELACRITRIYFMKRERDLRLRPKIINTKSCFGWILAEG